MQRVADIPLRHHDATATRPLFNVTATVHWADIDRNHQRAVATDEVLISPLGHNVFDDFGKKALFGRCFMFMDALAPAIVSIERAQGK